MAYILLIEDNREILENTAEILELAGYTTGMAGDGKQGIEMVQQKTPDLIVCDIMMPVLDGYGVLHMLSRNPETARIPFIFLSAKTERAHVRKGMDLGADDYITKPFETTELLNAIERRLQKAALARQQYDGDLQGLSKFIEEVSGNSGLSEFIGNRDTREYRKKEVIYREGEHPRYLYYLNKGKIRLSRMHDYGKEFTVSLINAGQFFGYTALLEDAPYVEQAETLEDCELILIPRTDFNKLVFGNREVAATFLKILTANLQEQQEKLLDLAYSSVRKRVAEALLQLQKKFSEEGQKQFSISITREDLASIAGTATETLIRTLGDFKHEKLVEIREGRIFIVDEKKLRDIRH